MMQKVLKSDPSGFCYEAENQPFSGSFYYNSPCFDLDRAEPSHKILGFGASLTDASCYLIHRLPKAEREKLLHEFFAPDGLALSVARLNVGSSDYATCAYSYDDGPEDMKLERFSIGHDRQWIIPTVKAALKINPELRLLASPWSPPGWMKTTDSLCGGWMRAKYLPVFADYLIKYLQAYREEGIEIHALTMQNEPNTDQNGRMPQSLLHPDFEMELVGQLMPPRLKAAGLNTAVWLYDHNYSGWKRVLYELSDPEVRKNIEAVAFHPYAGTPDMLGPLREAYPEIRFQLTEKGPNLRKDSAESSILWWCRTINGALNHGCESFFGWNFALTENGTPNVGYYDCAGLVEIHSRTGAITPSVQYHAFRHYAPFIRRGAEVLRAPLNLPLEDGVDCLLIRNPDGSVVTVAGNAGPAMRSVQIKYRGQYLKLSLSAGSMLTAVF